MAKHMGMLRGTIALLNRETGEIDIEAAHGLSARQRERGRYHLGEGITGKVVPSGQPTVVPHISEDHLFLDRTGARSDMEKADISFICVPVKVGNDRQSAVEAQQRLREENVRLQQTLKDRFQPANIISKSRAMQMVYDLIGQVSASNTTVLIRGESGTGKELVPHAIHYKQPSHRQALHQGQLRGAARERHRERAVRPREGRPRQRGGHAQGALRVGQRRHPLPGRGGRHLSAATQVKLMRVIQEREFEHVGGTATVKTDVRAIAATNRDLEKLINKSQFRQDLYYRLNVFLSTCPPCASAAPTSCSWPTTSPKSLAKTITKPSGAPPHRPSTC
ncbi:hypothetical protein DFAR_2290002 [Desulfarculales bacterium]